MWITIVQLKARFPVLVVDSKVRRYWPPHGKFSEILRDLSYVKSLRIRSHMVNSYLQEEKWQMAQQICTGSSALTALWSDRALTHDVLAEPAALQSLYLVMTFICCMKDRLTSTV